MDLLLSQSVNPNMLNKVSMIYLSESPRSTVSSCHQDSKTALDVAVEHEQWEVVELLVGRGATSGEGMLEMVHM